MPIPGTRKSARLRENIGAVELSLSPDDVRRIESAVAAIGVAGERRNEAAKQLQDRTI